MGGLFGGEGGGGEREEEAQHILWQLTNVFLFLQLTRQDSEKETGKTSDIYILFASKDFEYISVIKCFFFIKGWCF